MIAQGVVNHVQDPFASFIHLYAQRTSQPLFKRGQGLVPVQLDPTAKKIVRRKIAQHQVHIGHRDLGMIETYADLGAGTVGAQADPLIARVHMDFRARARANGVNAQSRRVQAMARKVQAPRDRQQAIDNRAHVKRGALQVAAHDILPALGIGQCLAAQDAANGSRDNGLIQPGVTDTGHRAV